jgi:hypothetical protein
MNRSVLNHSLGGDKPRDFVIALNGTSLMRLSTDQLIDLIRRSEGSQAVELVVRTADREDKMLRFDNHDLRWYVSKPLPRTSGISPACQRRQKSPSNHSPYLKC